MVARAAVIAADARPKGRDGLSLQVLPGPANDLNHLSCTRRPVDAGQVLGVDPMVG